MTVSYMAIATCANICSLIFTLSDCVRAQEIALAAFTLFEISQR